MRLATTENAGRYHHYQAVVEEFDFKDQLSPPFDDSLQNVDGLIVSCDQHPLSRLAVAACKSRGIPTFHVLDGVIDWRTTFDNPKFDLDCGGVPLFQPLLSDCVFAMGELQKRQLAWLGNKNVYATGFPRFDPLQTRPCRSGAVDHQPRLLIATANTPWVTAEQQQVVTSQFRGLMEGIDKSTPQIEPTWRIARSLGETLGLNVNANGTAAQALDNADAVITTPSTFAVESILKGVPTLIFDPFAFPSLTPSAWHANHWESVLFQLPNLLTPSSAQAQHQNWLAKSSFRADGLAANRIAETINRVIKGQLPTEEIASPNQDTPTFEIFKDKKFTPEQAAALEVSVGEFDRTIADLRQQLKAMNDHQTRPTARYVLGTIVRYSKQCLTRAKTQ